MSNISVIRNDHTISARVAEIMSKLPPKHSRSEAFAAINNAHILDKNGEPIKPSLWYHMLAYNVKPNGKTTMHELYPNFIPTPSPYTRPKTDLVERKIRVEKSELQTILSSIEDLTKKVNHLLKEDKDNSIHASIHKNDETGMGMRFSRKA